MGLLLLGRLLLLYTSPCEGFICQVGSTISRFDPGSKQQVKLGSVPFIISGAGVSTCAPTTMPK